MNDFPYPDYDGRVDFYDEELHFYGCWKTRGHHNCAVARIIALEDVIIRDNILFPNVQDKHDEI